MENNIVENQEELKAEITVAVATLPQVVDQVTYENANGRIAYLQTIRKEVVSRFADPKKKAQEAHKAVCSLEKSFLEPIDATITSLKDATIAYYTAEQRRIAAEAERRRKEAEEIAALAYEAEEAGDTAFAAEAVVAAAIESATVTTMPKCTGTSMREVWSAEVIDPELVPRMFMVVDQKALDAYAKTTKGTKSVPGVKFVKSFINSTRAK